jgi:prepilin-type N-terminal cleavage/methylation domain-containing protein
MSRVRSDASRRAPGGGAGHGRAAFLPGGGVARRRRGFTLLEVLAATLVLGLGLVGVGSMVTYSVVSHEKSVNYTLAAERASAEVERVREAGYLGAKVTTDLFPAPAYTLASATKVTFTVAELKGGQGSITIDEDAQAKATDPNTGSAYNNMKLVQVAITWTGSRNLSGSYQTATLVANRP